MSNDNQPSNSPDAPFERSTYKSFLEPCEVGSYNRTRSEGNSKAGPLHSHEAAAEEQQEVTERYPQLSNVLVAIPAYNEEAAIGSVILATKQMTDNVLVVDDGSSDNTAEIARAAGAKVIQHNRNKGKGAAIKTIFRYMITEEFEALVLIDGDGQHMPQDIPEVVDPIINGTCDIVIGSRYIDQDRTQTPIYRRVGQKILDYATLGLTGRSVSDSQSGFRAFSPCAVKQISITTDGMGVESEMLSKASEQDLDFKEVPIDIRYDGIDGQTYNPFHHGLSVLVFVLQLIRDRHPMVFFGLPGFAMLVSGSGVAIHSATLYQSTGVFHQWRFAASGLVIIIGILSLFTGFILNQTRKMFNDLK